MCLGSISWNRCGSTDVFYVCRLPVTAALSCKVNNWNLAVVEDTMNTARPSTSIFPDLEEPIRAELFSVERLEQHAETLAAAQIVTTQSGQGRPVTPRVLENGRALLESYRAIARAIQQEHAITPAAEWLVDNFHIVDEQLREIRDDLPPGF